MAVRLPVAIGVLIAMAGAALLALGGGAWWPDPYAGPGSPWTWPPANGAMVRMVRHYAPDLLVVCGLALVAAVATAAMLVALGLARPRAAVVAALVGTLGGLAVARVGPQILWMAPGARVGTNTGKGWIGAHYSDVFYYPVIGIALVALAASLLAATVAPRIPRVHIGGRRGLFGPTLLAAACVVAVAWVVSGSGVWLPGREWGSYSRGPGTPVTMRMALTGWSSPWPGVLYLGIGGGLAGLLAGWRQRVLAVRSRGRRIVGPGDSRWWHADLCNRVFLACGLGAAVGVGAAIAVPGPFWAWPGSYDAGDGMWPLVEVPQAHAPFIALFLVAAASTLAGVVASRVRFRSAWWQHRKARLTFAKAAPATSPIADINWGETQVMVNEWPTTPSRQEMLWRGLPRQLLVRLAPVVALMSQLALVLSGVALAGILVAMAPGDLASALILATSSVAVMAMHAVASVARYRAVRVAVLAMLGQLAGAVALAGTAHIVAEGTLARGVPGSLRVLLRAIPWLTSLLGLVFLVMLLLTIRRIRRGDAHMDVGLLAKPVQSDPQH